MLPPTRASVKTLGHHAPKSFDVIDNEHANTPYPVSNCHIKDRWLVLLVSSRFLEVSRDRYVNKKKVRSDFGIIIGLEAAASFLKWNDMRYVFSLPTSLDIISASLSPLLLVVVVAAGIHLASAPVAEKPLGSSSIPEEWGEIHLGYKRFLKNWILYTGSIIHVKT